MIDSVEPIKDKFVLEVACNSGEFLENLIKYAPQAAIGVDPSAPEKDAKPLVLQRTFFDEEYLKKMSCPVDILINRHMIEHMQSPLKMLRLFRRSLSEKGILYLETPRLDWILEHRAFFDFSYEHCAYYSDEFFVRLLSTAGFKIAKMSTSYSGQYFSIIAKKTVPCPGLISADGLELEKIRKAFSKLNDFYSSIRLPESFQQAYTEIEKRNGRIRLSDSLRPSGVYLWGAAAKGVMCANLLRGWRIEGFIDKNPQKQHKFIPVTGHPVLAPSEISFDKVKMICVENEVYFSEICDEVEQIDPRIKTVMLDDLLRQAGPKG